jgi:hypothetical protein
MSHKILSSQYADDIRKWEVLAAGSSDIEEMQAEYESASDELFMHTMMSLRLLQKEILETNWMFDSFES